MNLDGRYGIHSDYSATSNYDLNADNTNQNLIETIPVSQVKDSVKNPTMEENVIWQWQQNKMYIADSHYLPSLNIIEIAHTGSIQHKGIQLPVREINKGRTDWLTIVLILSLVLFAIVRIGYTKYLGSLFQSVFNYSTSLRMFGEKNYAILHGASLLEAMFYVLFSVFLFQVLVFFSLQAGYSELLFFGKTLAAVIVYFLGKKWIYKLLGIIFNGTEEASEFIFNVNNYNRVTGIILFPVVALLAYYPYEHIIYIVFSGGIIIFGLYVFLLQRGISILLKKQFSIFYLFLYLCTLEFLPLLLIFKIVVE